MNGCNIDISLFFFKVLKRCIYTIIIGVFFSTQWHISAPAYICKLLFNNHLVKMQDNYMYMYTSRPVHNYVNITKKYVEMHTKCYLL